MAIVLLSFGVLVLAFLVVALYVQVANLTPRSDAAVWPLAGIGPSQPLPSLSGLSDFYTGFLTLVDGRHDAFAVVVAVDAVAADWDTRSMIAVRDPEQAGWLGRVSSGRTALAAPEDFMRSCGPTSFPTVLYVRDGRVTDALVGGWSPSAVAEHFRLAAGHLVDITAGRKVA